MEINVDMEVVQAVYTDDHTLLKNRDAENQHPQSAITGLTERLGEMEDQDDVMTIALNTHTDLITALEGTTAEHGEAITELTEKVSTPATEESLGVVKIGEGINVDEDGTISAESGGGGTFIVTLTLEEDVFVPDKTLSELVEAYENGQTIVMSYEGGYSNLFQLSYYYTDGLPDNAYLEFSGSTYQSGSVGTSPIVSVIVWDVTDGVETIEINNTDAFTEATKNEYGLVKLGDGTRLVDSVVSSELIASFVGDTSISCDATVSDIVHATETNKCAVIARYKKSASDETYIDMAYNGSFYNEDTQINTIEFSCMKTDLETDSIILHKLQWNFRSRLPVVDTIVYSNSLIPTMDDLDAAIGGAINGSY